MSDLEQDVQRVQEVHAALEGPQKVWALVTVHTDHKGTSMGVGVYASLQLACDAFRSDFIDGQGDTADDPDETDRISDEANELTQSLITDESVLVGETYWSLQECRVRRD